MTEMLNSMKSIPAPCPSVQGFRYIHDKSTGLFHVPGCPKCTDDAAFMQGFGTLKGCMKRKLFPCSCCRKDAEKYWQERGTPYEGLLYSTRSSRKIIHFQECGIIHRTPRASVRTFATLDSAWKNGYCLCKACSPLAKLYQREEAAIRDFCLTHSMKVSLETDCIHVISQYDFWRMLIDRYKGSPELYHRNRIRSFRKEDSGIPQYHKQGKHADTLLELLQYIADHDVYRASKGACSNKSTRNDKRGNPSRRSKAGQHKAKQKKQKQMKRDIAQVLSLIEELAVCQN